MKPLYEQKWFCDFINWLRVKSPWFEKYGWGKSKNMEDFVRNPFEVFKDTFPPFTILDIIPHSLLLRFGYIPYEKDLEEEYYAEVENHLKVDPLPPSVFGTYRKLYEKTLGFSIGIWRIVDLAFGWISKYPNAGFMLQIAVCMKYKFIPLPFIGMNIKFTKTRYFQFGIGWAPTKDGDKWKATMCAKFRLANYDKELAWNPGLEVFGYWEGKI